VAGFFKVQPPSPGAPAPPGLYPPPSTGTQTPQPAPARYAPQQQNRYDSGPTGTLQTLPEPELPGGAGETAVGVVESVPLPGGAQDVIDGIALPAAQVGDSLDGATAGLPIR
jgi:hypothetical protein